MDYKILWYDSATSSNDIAKELAEKNEPHFTTIVVNSQTKGRGRTGRSFISSSENGLYMSMILRPNKECSYYNTLTPMIAVAVLRALEKTAGVSPKIKWVNDLYLNDKKICGILTESKLNSNGYEYIICGIGVNITLPENGFDNEIAQIAGAVFENTAPKNYKETLCKAIITELISLYNLECKEEYMKAYKENSLIIGLDVDVYVGDKVYSGKAIDIDENGELVVECINGEIKSFNSGEARVRKSGVPL